MTCSKNHKINLTKQQIAEAERIICLTCGEIIKDRSDNFKPEIPKPKGWEDWIIKEEI